MSGKKHCKKDPVSDSDWNLAAKPTWRRQLLHDTGDIYCPAIEAETLAREGAVWTTAPENEQMENEIC